MRVDDGRPGAVDRQGGEQRLSRLMELAQGGDGRAYAELLREVSVVVRSVVRSRRRGAGTADVEDLVQDVMLSLHAVRATYDPSRPFTPWLMAIVRNRIADGARRYARRQAQDERDYDVTLSLYSGQQSDDDVSGRQAQLTTALARLPAAQRQAIELTKLRAMSLEEASRETGVSVGAIKQLVHRAMKTLRRTMGGD
jgi:RNA polymerase sigma-70 factor (ECF subfamily)